MTTALLWNLALTSVLAILIAIVCRLPAMQRRPALRHAFWLLLLAKLVTPPLIPVPLLPVAEVSEPAVSPSVLGSELTGPSLTGEGPLPSAAPALRGDALLLTAGDDWLTKIWATEAIHGHFLLLLGWGLVSSVLLTIHAFRAARLRRWLRRAGAHEAILTRCCEGVAAAMGIRTPIRNCVVEARMAPFLFGCRQPIVVLPRQLIDELSADELQCVVAHELAHYLRRDHWSNLFAFLVKILMWWNPVAWWAHREARAAQELCCDAIAIELVSRRSYATALLRALDFVRKARGTSNELALGMGAERSILRRFEMMADTHVSHRLSSRMLLLLLLLIVPLFSFPVSGQEPAASGQADEAIGDETKGDNVRGGGDANRRRRSSRRVGADAKSVALVGIVWTRADPGSAKQPKAWLTDRTRNTRSVLGKGESFSVGEVTATIADIRPDEVTLKLGKERRKWKLGSTFATVQAPAARPADTPATKQTRRVANEKDKTANGKRKSVQIQMELLNDPPDLLIIRGKKEDVKRAAELLRRLEQADRKGEPQAPKGDEQGRANNEPEDKAESKARLMTYRLETLDPAIVVDVLKQVMNARPGVRMSADVKTNSLIVLARPEEHETIRKMLSALQPAKTPAENAQPRQPGNRTLKFAFRQQPWRDVLEWFAKQSGLSLVSEDNVPGAFTYADTKALSVVEAMDLLNGVLQPKGYTLLRRGGLLMVADVEANTLSELVPRVPVEELDKRGSYEFLSVLFPLGRRDPGKIREEVLPLLGPGGRASVLPRSRLLHVVERGRVLRDIRKIIEAIPER